MPPRAPFLFRGSVGPGAMLTSSHLPAMAEGRQGALQTPISAPRGLLLLLSALGHEIRGQDLDPAGMQASKSSPAREGEIR